MWYFILPAIVLFLLILRNDVIADYNKWVEGKPVNHFKEACIRALLLIPPTILLSLPDINLYKVLISMGLQAFTYLLLFDGFYNLKREQNWWFLGSIDPDDSWWDKQQRKIPLWMLKVLKIAIPATFLALKFVG